MDIKAKKLDLIDWLINLEDETMIEQLARMEQQSSSNYCYDDLPQAAKNSIERGLKDVREGRVSSHEEVWKRLKAKHPYLK